MRYITLFFLLIARGLSAQPQAYALSGSVTDAATGKPIPAVSVFLNGTSKGTTTHDDGAFLLTGIRSGSYQLIISAVGYATFQTTIDTRALPSALNVTLKTRSTELTAVTVEPGNENGWKKWGKIFWDNFIGTTENASFCTIENKDALRFHYDRNIRKLTVSAVEPITIFNNALGYKIEYRLEAYSYELSTEAFSYHGYIFFREMIPNDSAQQQDWIAARRRVYMGSMRHFFRSLYSGRLREEGFVVAHEVKVPNKEKARVQAIYKQEAVRRGSIPGDTPFHYRKILRQPDYYIRTLFNYDSLVAINPDQTQSFTFTGDFIVTYSNATLGIGSSSSTLKLVYPVSLQIDENGSYLPVQTFFTKGIWAKTQTVCNLVPSDYIPPSADPPPVH
jgi:hypothetical protein